MAVGRRVRNISDSTPPPLWRPGRAPYSSAGPPSLSAPSLSSRLGSFFFGRPKDPKGLQPVVCDAQCCPDSSWRNISTSTILQFPGVERDERGTVCVDHSNFSIRRLKNFYNCYQV